MLYKSVIITKVVVVYWIIDCGILTTCYSYCSQGNLSSLLTSVTFLKKAVCTTLLSFMNLTSPNPVSHSLVMFCQSNSTALEVTLNVLNQVRVYMCPKKSKSKISRQIKNKRILQYVTMS